MSNIIPIAATTSPDPRRFELTEWFLEPLRAHSNPATKVRLWGQPVPPRSDGLFLRSSSIANRISQTLLQTRNGSQIILSSPISRPYACKQGMSPRVIDSFADGFPSTWKLDLLDAFPAQHPPQLSSRPQSSRSASLPPPLSTPLPSSVCPSSPHPKPNLTPLTEAQSRDQRQSRHRTQTRQSGRITRSQASLISKATLQPDPRTTEKPTDVPQNKPSTRKTNRKSSAVQSSTRILRSHRSTLPPSQNGPPSNRLRSLSDEQAKTTPVRYPRRTTRKPLSAAKASSSPANREAKQSRSSVAKPTQPANRSDSQQAQRMTRSRRSRVESEAPEPVKKASRKRKSSSSDGGTERNGTRRKSMRLAKGQNVLEASRRFKGNNDGGGKGLLAQRLKKAHEVKTARRSRRVSFADRNSKGQVNVTGTADGRAKTETTRMRTPGRVLKERVMVEDWTAGQLRDYETGRNSVAADEVGYWDKVAEGIEGKSGDDCRTLWEGTWSSPQQGKKKEGRRVGTPEMVSGLLKAGKTARGRGTGKFRTRARMLADRVANGLGDEELEPMVLGNDQVETPRNVAGVEVGTPGTVVRKKKRGLEEAGRLETPEILSRGRNVGFEEADRYVSSFWRRAGQRSGEDKSVGGCEEGKGDEGKMDDEEDVEEMRLGNSKVGIEIGDGDEYSDEEPFF